MLRHSNGTHSTRHIWWCVVIQNGAAKKEKKDIKTQEKEGITRKIKESVRETRYRGWKQAKVNVASEVDKRIVRKWRSDACEISESREDEIQYSKENE